jgi:CelD/BcsL family acetyltransferase involved in cellulose biosynthesis
MLIDGISIRIATDLKEIEAEWLNLEARSSCSLFQNFQWNDAWVNNFSKVKAISVQVVLGYDSAKNLQFILPFQITKKFGFRVLEWLAQPASSYGIGIYDREFAGSNWLAQNFDKLLSALKTFDVIKLENLPNAFEGLMSPLHHLNKFEGANTTYITKLHANYESLLHAKRGHNSLKSMRKRDRRLQELGEVKFLQNSVEWNTLQNLLESKTTQLAAQGIFNTFEHPMPNFLNDVGQSYAEQVSIFELCLNSKTISSMYTAIHHDCFYPIIITLDADGPLQSSPGDVLLRHSIKWACESGLKKLDFSMGNAAFKQVWSDEEVLLFNFYATRGLTGLPLALFFMSCSFFKRKIKKSKTAIAAFSSLRKRFFGKTL